MRSQRLRLCHIAAALPLLLAAAGCSTSSASNETALSTGPRPATSDSYPNFSAPLDSAMAQMSDDEASRMEAQLSSLARQRQSGRISEAEYRSKVAELRRLAEQAK